MTFENMVDELRREEGAAVTICCDNPEFSGPNVKIEVVSNWTGWHPETYDGSTVWDCLMKAVKAKDAHKEANAVYTPGHVCPYQRVNSWLCTRGCYNGKRCPPRKLKFRTPQTGRSSISCVLIEESGANALPA